MWLHSPSTISQNGNKIFTSSRMLTILSLAMFAILVEASALNVPQNVLSARNGSESQQNASKTISTASSLSNKYNQFEKKYAQTLMNSKFLPFVGDCMAVIGESKPVTQLKLKDRFLCLTYFDMMNNLIANADEDFTLADKVTASLGDYDNATLVKNFCEFFGGELPTEDANRPFVMKLMDNQSVWMNATREPETCKQLCYYLDGPITLRISPICKLVSGGYRLIRKHSVDGKTAMKDGTLPIDSTKMQSKSSQNISAKVAGEQVKAVSPISNEVKAQPAAASTVTNTSQSTTTGQNQIQVVASSASKHNNNVKPSEEAKKNTSPMAKAAEEAAAQETSHASNGGKENTHNEATKLVVATHQEEEEVISEDIGEALGKIQIQLLLLLFYKWIQF